MATSSEIAIAVEAAVAGGATVTCSGCSAKVSPLAIFPGGVCITCYESNVPKLVTDLLNSLLTGGAQ